MFHAIFYTYTKHKTVEDRSISFSSVLIRNCLISIPRKYAGRYLRQLLTNVFQSEPLEIELKMSRKVHIAYIRLLDFQKSFFFHNFSSFIYENSCILSSWRTKLHFMYKILYIYISSE